MSDFKFSCPQCGQHILCDALWSGCEINCPTCRQPMVLPSLAPPAPPIAQQASAAPATAVAPSPRVLGRRVPPSLPPRVPLLVRIYGIITMIFGVLGVVLIVLYMALRSPGGPLGVVIGGVVIIYMVVVVRIGKGMRSGERQAIYGLCVLGLIEVGFRLFSFAAASRGGTHHLWFLAFSLGVFYFPPLVSAFRNWAAFK